MVKIYRFANGKMCIDRENEHSEIPADFVTKHTWEAQPHERIGFLIKGGYIYDIIAINDTEHALFCVGENGDSFFANIEDIVLEKGEHIIITAGGFDTTYSWYNANK